MKSLVGLFNLNTEVEKKPISHDIEMMDNKYYAVEIYYKDDDSQVLVDMPNIIYFHHDGVRIGGSRLKYEHIATFNRHDEDNMVILTTFTRMNNYNLECFDSLGQIAIIFHDIEKLNIFMSKFLSKILYYKDLNMYDKNIYKFKSFSEIFRRQRVKNI